jgi:hypothetical protein
MDTLTSKPVSYWPYDVNPLKLILEFKRIYIIGQR